MLGPACALPPLSTSALAAGAAASAETAPVVLGATGRTGGVRAPGAGNAGKEGFRVPGSGLGGGSDIIFGCRVGSSGEVRKEEDYM